MTKLISLGSLLVTLCIGLSLTLLLGGAVCSPGPGPGDGDGVVCLDLSSNIDSATTLSAACYNVTSNIFVNAALTIGPGVTLKFNEGRTMRIDSGGSLYAVGTADDPIVFKGQEAVAGYWGGLTFYYSNSSSNQLAYVTIQDGGAADDANLMTTGNDSQPARLSVSHCTFSNSAGYGMYLDVVTNMTDFASNTLTDNAQGAASVEPDMVGWLDAASSYDGNTVEGVEVRSDNVTEDQTWQGIGVPYRISGSIGVNAALTIAAGAELSFASGRTMTVSSDGSLRAVGTAASRIVFTGSEEVPGYWGGLTYYYSNSTNNRLEYVTIEYGGSSGEANLMTVGNSSQPARLVVKNCILRNSAGFGLYLNDVTNMTEFASNTLTGNEEGAASVETNMAGWLDDAGTYTGNTVNGVEVRYGSVTDAQTWQAIGVPFLCNADIGVNADLTIAAGATLKFGSGDGMVVHDDGSLSAVGTALNPIIFTGMQSTPGYWDGLEYYYSGSLNNVLAYVTISYGGNVYGNLFVNGGSASATANNCTFSHSSSYGVYADGPTMINSDVETVNSFASNASGNVFIAP